MNESEVPLCSHRGIKLGIICNLKHPDQDHPSEEEAEFDEPSTVLAIRNALVSHGVETVIIEADRNLPQAIRDSGINMAFNIAEGKGGRSREAQVPALLDLLGIPYTGSDPVALGLSLDKGLCKQLMAAAGVPTAPHVLVHPGQPRAQIPFAFPVILKPNAEGSGKGISENCIAESEEELDRLLAESFASEQCDMLAEEYLPGREFTVGLIGNGDTLQVMPPMEIIYHGNTQRRYKVYSYDVKCNFQKHVSYQCPAQLSSQQMEQLKQSARTAFQVLGCQDVARIDFRMDAEGEACFLEINPLPGLAPGYSDLPMIAKAAGYDYDSFVCAIFDAACARLAGGSHETH